MSEDRKLYSPARAALSVVTPHGCPACMGISIEVVAKNDYAYARCADCGLIPSSGVLEYDESMDVDGVDRDALLAWNRYCIFCCSLRMTDMEDRTPPSTDA